DRQRVVAGLARARLSVEGRQIAQPSIDARAWYSSGRLVLHVTCRRQLHVSAITLVGRFRRPHGSCTRSRNTRACIVTNYCEISSSWNLTAVEDMFQAFIWRS